MKSITPLMDAHLAGSVTTLCSCWKITREDGVVLGFTDHDRSLTIGGVLYKASTGYYRSAISNSASSGADNLDVSGFMSDDSLDETELRNGAYDYAQVEIFATNWQNPEQGIVRLRYGYFGEVMIVSSGFFKVELRGLTQLFSQTIVETYSPECRADLGDHRCKVQLEPPVRESVKSYSLGQRILVPIPPGISLSLPLKNGGFEYHDITVPWNYPAGTVKNTNDFDSDPLLNPFSEKDVYRLIPTSDTGTLSFTRSKVFLGATPISDLSALVELLEGGEGAQVRLSAWWENMADPPAKPTPDPLHQWDKTSDWVTLTVGSNEVELPQPLGAAEDNNNFRYARYQIEWRNVVPGTIRLVGYPKIDGEVLPQSDLTPSGLPLSIAATNDWQSTPNARVSGPNVWVSPFMGDWMLELAPGPKSTESAWQDVDLEEAFPDNLDDIDTGTLLIKLDAMTAAATVGVEASISFRFFDADGDQIGISNQESKHVYGKGTWGPFDYSVELPKNTRKVRVQLNTTNFTDNARARGVWDNVVVRIFEEAYENQDNYLAYGGVEFECVQAGLTQVVLPEYEYTLGAVTVDGSAQFKCVIPLHMFTTKITEVINNKQFKISSAIDKPNEWFEWGVIEMLSGNNYRKKLEIAKWDNATKTVTLALALPYLPEVGDDLRMHTGCAKSREVCVSKFNNIINYRGEPDLPGTDQYFKIGGANAGSSPPAGKGGGK